MNNIIEKVLPNSIAEEVEIEPGDKLISINGNAIKDIIDYRFLITDEYLELEIEKSCGEIWEIEVEKDYDEELGIEFAEAILDKAKTCTNNCMFCFVHQLPKGMRETLYFKDDDSRLSFLQGNFVTLTNMKEEDIERIIKYRISPINVSVHTTNPELRVKMLNNRFAGKVYEHLKRFSEAGISINCQLVLCPGLNNGEELERTIKDLYELYPSVQNIAAVPLGITKFRDNLPKLKTYTKETAKQEIELVKKYSEKFMKEIGHPFIRLSDEFYVMAEEELPQAEFYGSYDQLEDGVGMLRLLENTIKENLEILDINKGGKFTFVTGSSAYKHINKISKMIMDTNPNIHIEVKKIINNFFGDTITVTGLLTGEDIIDQLKDVDLGDYIVMPNNLLKKGYELGKCDEQLLLDNYTVPKLEEILKKKIIICDFTGEDLIQLIDDHCREV